MLQTLECDDGVNVINTPPSSGDNGSEGGNSDGNSGGNTNGSLDGNHDGNTNGNQGGETTGTAVKPKSQMISGTSVFTKSIGTKFKLNAAGKTALAYKSSDNKVAQVDSKGYVTVKGYGKCRITVTAKATARYKSATKVITVNGVLAKPNLKAVAKRGRKIKLTWSKVDGSDGYMVYIKTPGQKKFKLAVTKSRKVKGVTNRGLLKGKKYSYKVRAFKKVSGRMVYSRYSKVVTAKAKK